MSDDHKMGIVAIVCVTFLLMFLAITVTKCENNAALERDRYKDELEKCKEYRCPK